MRVLLSLPPIKIGAVLRDPPLPETQGGWGLGPILFQSLSSRSPSRLPITPPATSSSRLPTAPLRLPTLLSVPSPSPVFFTVTPSGSKEAPKNDSHEEAVGTALRPHISGVASPSPSPIAPRLQLASGAMPVGKSGILGLGYWGLGKGEGVFMQKRLAWAGKEGF